MTIVKRDVCLWSGKKSGELEKTLVARGLESGSVCLMIEGERTEFVPMNGAKGLKPVTKGKWVALPYGAEVEVKEVA